MSPTIKIPKGTIKDILVILASASALTVSGVTHKDELTFRHQSPANVNAGGLTTGTLELPPGPSPKSANKQQPQKPGDVAPHEHPPAATRGAEFGQWETGEANLRYQAESDGFITAFTDDPNPAKGILVHVGEDPSDLPVRTRASKRDGVVCPVSEGDYWTVRPTNNKGTLTVYWLPLRQSEAMEE